MKFEGTISPTYKQYLKGITYLKKKLHHPNVDQDHMRLESQVTGRICEFYSINYKKIINYLRELMYIDIKRTHVSRHLVSLHVSHLDLLEPPPVHWAFFRSSCTML